MADPLFGNVKFLASASIPVSPSSNNLLNIYKDKSNYGLYPNLSISNKDPGIILSSDTPLGEYSFSYYSINAFSTADYSNYTLVNDLPQFTSPNWNLSSGSVTVDGWVRVPNHLVDTTSVAICEFIDQFYFGLVIFLEDINDNGVKLVVYHTSTGSPLFKQVHRVNIASLVDTWMFFSYTDTGTNNYLHVNGVLVASSSVNSGIISSISGNQVKQIRILSTNEAWSAVGAASRFENSYRIKELRLTDAARYSSSNYAIPTSYFESPNIRSNIIPEVASVSSIVGSSLVNLVPVEQVNQTSFMTEVSYPPPVEQVNQTSLATTVPYLPPVEQVLQLATLPTAAVDYLATKVIDTGSTTSPVLIPLVESITDSGSFVTYEGQPTENTLSDSIGLSDSFKLPLVEQLTSSGDISTSFTVPSNNSATITESIILSSIAIQPISESLLSNLVLDSLTSETIIPPQKEEPTDSIFISGSAAVLYNESVSDVIDTSVNEDDSVHLGVAESISFNASTETIGELLTSIIDLMPLSEVLLNSSQNTLTVSSELLLNSLASSPYSNVLIDGLIIGSAGNGFKNGEGTVTVTELFKLKTDSIVGKLTEAVVTESLSLVELAGIYILEELVNSLQLNPNLTEYISLTNRIIESISTSEVVIPNQSVINSVVELINTLEKITLLTTLFLDSSINLSESYSSLSKLLNRSIDNISLLEEATPARISLVTSKDTLFLTSENLSSAEVIGIIIEEMDLNTRDNSPSRFKDIAYNYYPETSAVTTYSNFKFNTATNLNGNYLFGNPNGLYLYGGHKDDGENITSTAVTSSMDFGSSNLKQVPYSYLGVSTDGEIYFKVRFDGKGEVLYKLNKRTNNLQTLKVEFGKGLIGRYFQFELVSSADELIIESIEFTPLQFKRKL